MYELKTNEDNYENLINFSPQRSMENDRWLSKNYLSEPGVPLLKYGHKRKLYYKYDMKKGCYKSKQR
jgi:hypothetical protein